MTIERGYAFQIFDANGQPVAFMGDISSLPWDGQPLPEGTRGLWTKNGYFSGELAAKIVRYGNLDIAFAQIVSVAGTHGDWQVEQLALDADDWNIIKGTAVMPSVGMVGMLTIYHTTLNNLLGAYEIMLSRNGTSWLNTGYGGFDDSYSFTLGSGPPGATSLSFGHQRVFPNKIDLAYRTKSGEGNDLWVGFKRHSIT